MHPRFQRLLGPNGFSIGLELPLDNDWSSGGQRLRMAEGRPFGVPDLRQHAAMARLADKSGFRAFGFVMCRFMTRISVMRHRFSKPFLSRVPGRHYRKHWRWVRRRLYRRCVSLG
jgi:hypothetical protein